MLCKRGMQLNRVMSAAGGNHLRRVLQAGFSHRSPAQHAGDFVGAGALIEKTDIRFGASTRLALVNEEMLIGECFSIASANSDSTIF